METDNYFVHNKETEKLNIYTTKQFYNALEQQKRKFISRFCLWSGRQQCWISKAKAENAIYLRSKLSEMGFVDRGSTGERLSFEEKVDKEQEKAAARAERSVNRAEKAKQRSDSLYNTASEMASVIPMGQPILVGHHSEKRDRRYREQIHNKMGQSVREQEKAEYYRSKAESAEWTARGEKYKNPNYLLNRIKEAKSAIKRFGRHLEGNFYRSSPNREISTVERDVYTQKLKEYQEKLAFFEQHMLKVNPKYFEQSIRQKSKKNNRGL